MHHKSLELAPESAHAHFSLANALLHRRAPSSEAVKELQLELKRPGWDLTLCRAVGAGSDTTFARLPQILDLPSELWAYVRRDANGAFHCQWDLPFDRVAHPRARPQSLIHARR